VDSSRRNSVTGRNLPWPDSGNAKLRDWRYELAMLSGPLQLIAAVRERFGRARRSPTQAEVEPWLTDWRGPFHGRPQGVLAPVPRKKSPPWWSSAARHAVPLVPQGGNTSMVGGRRRRRTAAPDPLFAPR
jgi:hypothetical protein